MEEEQAIQTSLLQARGFVLSVEFPPLSVDFRRVSTDSTIVHDRVYDPFQHQIGKR
jgi:hypothetical protein